MSEDGMAGRAAAWIVGHDTGASSKALWAVMMGQKGDGSHPSDNGDLGRCLRLLEALPEWRARIQEMASVSPYWAALVARWDELARTYYDDKEGGRTYKLMKSILDPIMDKDRNVMRIKGGGTIWFGR